MHHNTCNAYTVFRIWQVAQKLSSSHQTPKDFSPPQWRSQYALLQSTPESYYQELIVENFSHSTKCPQVQHRGALVAAEVAVSSRLEVEELRLQSLVSPQQVNSIIVMRLSSQFLPHLCHILCRRRFSLCVDQVDQLLALLRPVPSSFDQSFLDHFNRIPCTHS